MHQLNSPFFAKREMEIVGAMPRQDVAAEILTPPVLLICRVLSFRFQCDQLTNRSMNRPQKANRGLACAGVTIWASGGGIEPHTV